MSRESDSPSQSFGPSTARSRSCEPWPFLPFRASVPLERTDGCDLLCPLLTSAPRWGRLAAPSVLRRRGRLGTRRRPPEVSSTAFPAHPPDVHPRPLMDGDFAVTCPLVRPGLPRIRFLSVRSRFWSTLLSDAASRRRPCASLALHLHQVVQGTCTPKLSNMLGTQVSRCAAGRPGAPHAAPTSPRH